jgi:hypothetical protein
MMDLELRLAALSKLMDNKSEAVEQRLSEEFRRSEDLLRQGTDYDELVVALKTLAVLGPRFHGAVVPLLTDFVRSVRTRALTQGGELIPASRLLYRSSAHLIREAIDATTSVRYLHTEAFVDFLLELSKDNDDEVRGKAERALEAVAEFDLDIFYGGPGMGAKPQADIVAHLASLDEGQLVANAEVILRILRKVLSPSMEGHSWTYSSVTISRGGIVSGGGVSEMRAAAIALAMRLYPLGGVVAYRKSVLRTLGAATPRERPAVDAATAAMFERDAIEVLHFMRDLVPNEALPLVQSIEHDGYWNYHHASSEPIRAAALEIHDAVDKHAEYQIYKQLIGFEGIFGDWEQLRGSEAAWDYTDARRQEAARKFVEEIDDSYDEWRDRILKLSETESDDLATFPVYNGFLELLGQKKPHLALELVTAHERHMDRFLIPLVSGLWSSDRQADIETIVQRWIAEGVHLTVAAKSLFKEGAKRLEILKAVVQRSAQIGYLNALVNAMGVAASLHAQGCASAKAVFMLALRELAKHNDASWSSAVWFSRDFRSLVATMDAAECAEVLSSMATLPKLSYQAEEVLSAVGEQDIHSLLAYLAGRLKEERLRDARERAADESPFDDNTFEAIPHHLHKLNHLLAKVPEAVLSNLRRDFEEEERSMFQYRSGARLMQAVFPGFDETLQTLLLKLVQDGTQDDIDFVLAVIRAYGGGAPILEVCKAIIKVVPEMSPAWNELAAAMESTGVVTGEYGFVHAFERKRDEIVPWKNDDNARVRAFAEWLTDILERQIVQERERADEGLALRKYKYGVGKDEG